MDLNYLHHRRQIELMSAADAACAPSRQAHAALATAYSRIIAARTAARRPEPA